MPDPKVCNKIVDPAARRRCLNYEGEFAEPAGSNPGTDYAGGIAKPTGAPAPPDPEWSRGFRQYMDYRKKKTTY